MPSRSELTARDSTIPFTPTILDLDRPWRYLVGQPEDLGPPADWADPDFDDSNWPTGLPGFGFGDDDDTTALQDDGCQWECDGAGVRFGARAIGQGATSLSCLFVLAAVRRRRPERTECSS